ncbi:hypothetical protein SLA_4669 [Streptomyces laurentii]|uniref:Uncharacterized protein n=1 Tax=Streptomyces laurentii TaxID=39478 RepID=A0A160P4K9_STRLU|nr:hypothetical protein SLA_4669 [Streptomyces laurentii]
MRGSASDPVSGSARGGYGSGAYGFRRRDRHPDGRERVIEVHITPGSARPVVPRPRPGQGVNPVPRLPGWAPADPPPVPRATPPHLRSVTVITARSPAAI